MFHTTSRTRTRLGPRLNALTGSIATAGAATAVLAPTPVLATGSEGFLVLQAGFTQTLFGTNNTFLGGLAFAANGDVWAALGCFPSGDSLARYSLAGTTTLHGSTLHTNTSLSSNAGCGLADTPDGTLYSNTSNGVAHLDAN